METKNNLGIWLDHSTANLIDLNSNKNSHSINSNFTTETKEEALSRSENLMHNKRQQMHEEFYKKIGAEILKYNNILLFGPTNARVELHNYLNKDLHFKQITIENIATDNMTKNEKYAFVKKHFEAKK